MMHKPVKYVEKAVTVAAKGAWAVFERLNRIKPNPSPTPKWSDKPLLKSYEKSKPPLGWPRTTDSLCPKCVPEIRQQILDGKLPHEILLNEKVGEIKANIIERDGKILMVKDCPMHGHFEDVMSIDPDFSQHLEEVFPGRDIRAHNDEKLHNHGSSTVKYGRGSVLTIDLTNRCNMMCDPCFMDANQVGFVHELSWEDIKTLLDNADHHQAAPPDVGAVLGRRADAVAVLPGRGSLRAQGWLQLRAGRDQRHRVREEPRVRAAGRRSRPALRLSAVRRHRQRRQLAPRGRQPVRCEAARRSRTCTRPASRSFRSSRSSTASTTSRSARIIKFALDNPKKIGFLSFQPVRFTGRDEAVTDERRAGAALHAVAIWRTT